MKFIHKFLNLIIAAALVLYGVFFYLNKNKFFESEAKTHQVDMSSVDVDSVVNRHMAETAKQVAIDQSKSKIKEQKVYQEFIQAYKPKKSVEVTVPIEKQIHKDNEIDHSSNEQARFDDQRNKSENEAQEKKEYARQYIENARKGGYYLELNDDLSVKSITPIRKPSQIDEVDIPQSN